jgi:dynein heavy chain
VPNLFPADDWMQIEERLRAVAKRNGNMQLHDHGTREQLEEFFVERSRLNLHIVVTMSPIGSGLRDSIRDFPALVSCCSIDWLTRWPNNALEAVCEQILADFRFPKPQMTHVS